MPKTATYRICPTLCAAPPHPRSSVRVSALSAIQEEDLLLEHKKMFTYGKEFAMTVNVTEAANGDQTVYIETDYPSANLILHWGVQGGRSYTGGWRLPDHRPKDTIQYKDRALQTSFKCDSAHLHPVLLHTARCAEGFAYKRHRTAARTLSEWQANGNYHWMTGHGGMQGDWR